MAGEEVGRPERCHEGTDEADCGCCAVEVAAADAVTPSVTLVTRCDDPTCGERGEASGEDGALERGLLPARSRHPTSSASLSMTAS